MSIFSHPEYDAHELVQFVHDRETGLRAIIAIHRTTFMGGGSGGCRMWPYATDEEALTDVLRLSRMMSYKLALAEVPMGGAKMVVIGDPADKDDALLRAIGKTVQRLRGRYMTGGDVNVGDRDLEIIGEETDFILAGHGGDASEATGYGVFVGVRTAVERRLETDLKGVKVAVQGLGHVGRLLCDHLAEHGAELVVTDLNDDAVKAVVDAHGATAVDPEAIYDADVDVFAPCALGAIVNDDTLGRLKCKVIAGGANNQLAEPRHGEALKQKGVLYAPDFVVNAGGAVSVGQRASGDDADMKEVERIGATLKDIFDLAEREDITPNEAAERLARKRARYL